MTIWFDYTTTNRSAGRNGIAAVEWNIGLALRQVRPDVRCCAMGGRRGLVEIDPEHALSGATYASQHVTAPPPGVTTWRDTARSVLGDRLGARAVPVIRTLSKVYGRVTSARRTVRAAANDWRTVIADDSLRLIDVVEPGDIVLSVGAAWEADVLAQLQRLRTERRCRVVTMVHDLIPLTHTHLAFSKDSGVFERYYRALLASSDLVLCNSESSRADLLDFAATRGLAAGRTEVVRFGDGHVAPSVGDAPRDDFFLWVGTIERRKNLELLYDAVRLLADEAVDPLPTIVVAGARGWGVGDLLDELELQSSPASRRFVLLGAVDDATLESLYRRARALLFPSHFEGWGLPVREGAIRGCPVAAGDSPAVREAADGFPGVVLLPPDDPAPWADYLRHAPPAGAAATFRPWSDFVVDLLATLGAADGP